MRSRYPRDPGLSARMVATMFGLGLLLVVFVAVLVLVRVPIVFVVVIAAVLLGAQYFFSDRIALFAMHAHEVTPAEAPELHAIVDRLCALADMPKPKVAIAEMDIPNAFATGRNPKAAVVCATTGILNRLEPAELEAVLAHELSHVAHRDVAVMTVASFLGIMAGLLTRFALFSGIVSEDEDRDSAGAFVLVVLASAVVYALSFLLTRALSRYRELSADRSAAVLTGAPATLAAALVKVTGEIGRIPTRDLRAAEPVNALLFAPALAQGFSLSSLFSTHPSLERRLDQLARIEADMGAHR